MSKLPLITPQTTWYSDDSLQQSPVLDVLWSRFVSCGKIRKVLRQEKQNRSFFKDLPPLFTFLVPSKIQKTVTFITDSSSCSHSNMMRLAATETAFSMCIITVTHRHCHAALLLHVRLMLCSRVNR